MIAICLIFFFKEREKKSFEAASVVYFFLRVLLLKRASGDLFHLRKDDLICSTIVFLQWTVEQHERRKKLREKKKNIYC